jgi:hypothetical protein
VRVSVQEAGEEAGLVWATCRKLMGKIELTILSGVRVDEEKMGRALVCVGAPYPPAPLSP